MYLFRDGFSLVFSSFLQESLQEKKYIFHEMFYRFIHNVGLWEPLYFISILFYIICEILKFYQAENACMIIIEK